MEIEGEITEEMWKGAEEHFFIHAKHYRDIASDPNANVMFAVFEVFGPIFIDWMSGDRSPELYQRMLEVE